MSVDKVAGGNGGQPDTSSIAGYTFSWNAADQLTSINSVRDGLTNYSYDANGNRTSVARGSAAGASSFSSTVTAHNRILNDGTSTYTYDAEGNRTSKTDIATGNKVEYQWNHANLLTAVIYKTSNNVVTKSVAYQYDDLGRRIGKSVDDNGNGTVDRRESYIYDGAGLLATGERQGVSPPSASSAIHISGPNGSLGQHGWTDQMVLSFVDADGDGSGTSQLSGRYLYGPAVDEIFAVENGKNRAKRASHQSQAHTSLKSRRKAIADGRGRPSYGHSTVVGRSLPVESRDHFGRHLFLGPRFGILGSPEHGVGELPCSTLECPLFRPA